MISIAFQVQGICDVMTVRRSLSNQSMEVNEKLENFHEESMFLHQWILFF
jgi:hypothetical protein